MGPIQSLGFDRPGWLQNIRNVGETNQSTGTGVAGPLDQVMAQSQGQSISALNINSSVSQMLKNVGVQDSQMLEMMIALLIMIALLEQQRGGGGGSADALSELGRSGMAMSSLSNSVSSTIISTQWTSISYTQTNVTQVSGGGADTGGQSKLDTTA